jgi:hypothetical protein
MSAANSSRVRGLGRSIDRNPSSGTDFVRATFSHKGRREAALPLPLHPHYRPAGRRVHIAAGMHKAVALIEADGAGIIGIDQ